MPKVTAPTLTVIDSLWEDIHADQDGLAPRLRATVVLDCYDTEKGESRHVDLYLTAICVDDPEPGYPQEARNAEDDVDLGRIYQVEGKDGPFDTVTIGGAGDNRKYVVFATSS